MRHIFTSFGKRRHQGISLVEITITSLAVTIIIAGIYQVMRGSEERQKQERLVSQATSDMRRAKEMIVNSLSKVYQDVDSHNYGRVLMIDGPIPVVAEPGNKFGEASTSPDQLTFIQTLGAEYGLNQNFAANATSITVKVTAGQLPPFESDDLVIISNRDAFELKRIGEDDPVFIPDAANPTAVTFSLENYTDSILKLSDGTAVTAFEYKDSSSLYNDPDNMQPFTPETSTIQRVQLEKYFLAPDSDNKVTLYRTIDNDDAAQKVTQARFHDMQLTAVLNDLTSQVSSTDLETAKNVAQINLSFRFATSERTETNSATISLQGKLGGNNLSKLAALRATPSENYQGDAGEILQPGAGVLVPTSDSVVAIRNVYTLTTQGSGTEVVGGKLQFIEDGEVFDPLGYDPKMPALNIDHNPYFGDVSVLLARQGELSGTEIDYTAQIIEIMEDENGEISVDSPSYQHTIPGFNSATVMVPFNTAGKDVRWLMSHDTPPDNPALQANKDRIRKAKLIYRDDPTTTPPDDKEFTTFADYNLLFPEGVSTLIVGAGIAKPTQWHDSVMILTSPAEAADGTIVPGGLFIFMVGVNTSLPDPAPDPGNVIKLGQILEFTDGPITDFKPIYIDGESRPTAYQISANTTPLLASYTAFSQMVLDLLANPGALVNMQTVTKVGNTVYCDNFLQPQMMSQAAIAAGYNNGLLYGAPMIKTAIAMKESNHSVVDMFFSSALIEPNLQELTYAPQLQRIYAGLMKASIEPNAVMTRAKVQLTWNGANTFGGDLGSGYFYPMIEQNPVTACQDNKPYYPPLPDPGWLEDARDMAIYLGVPPEVEGPYHGVLDGDIVTYVGPHDPGLDIGDQGTGIGGK